MSLKGKTLSITGASRRIGLAVALRAARDGPNIAIAAKTKTLHPKLEGTIHLTAKAIEGAGGQALIDDTFLRRRRHRFRCLLRRSKPAAIAGFLHAGPK